MNEQLDFFSNISDESKKAYAEITRDGTKGHRKAMVFRCVKDFGPITRMEISKMLNITLSCVCGRINELIGSGEVEEYGKTTCIYTGKTVNVIRIKQ